MASDAERTRMQTGSIPMTNQRSQGTIEVPAPTAWPIVLAFGVCLLFGGLATNAYVSILGAAAMLAGLGGWFRDVFPREAHEAVPVVGAVPTGGPLRPAGAPSPVATPE